MKKLVTLLTVVGLMLGSLSMPMMSASGNVLENLEDALPAIPSSD